MFKINHLTYFSRSGIMVFAILIILLFSSAASRNVFIKSTEDLKSKLEKAEKLYNDAKFDEAIDILKELTSGSSADTSIQKESLQLLGLSYTAKKQYDQAKDALISLMKLEPPLTVFNPDSEPPVFMKLYYKARKEFSGSYQVERPDPGIKTMAIIEFNNESITDKAKYDPMQKGFADLLISRLNNSTGLKVIERERIQWILDEINLQEQNKMDGAVRLGKLLGAHTVMLGSFIINNDQIWLGARLVKVETSEILQTDEVRGDLNDFFSLIDQLGNKISEKINITLNKLSKVQKSDAPSLDAVMSYSMGLDYLSKEDYKNAYAMFQEALKLDPQYEQAKARLQSITPYL